MSGHKCEHLVRQTIFDDDLNEIDRKVNYLLAEGWQMHGNTFAWRGHLLQVMVKGPEPQQTAEKIDLDRYAERSV